MPVKVLGDQKVVVFNKGGYVADLRVDYSLNVNGVLIPVRQSGSILVGQNYAFCKLISYSYYRLNRFNLYFFVERYPG